MSKTNSEEILPDVTNIKSSETYTLPSKGLLYTETDGIPSAITLRRMTTKEDKMRLRNETEDKIRKDILQACIVDKDVDAGKLKLMDANFLLFRLRSLSLLDDTYKVSCFCPACATQFIHEVNLSQIPIDYITKTKLSNLKTTLPVCGQTVEFKYPSLDNFITTGDDLRSYYERFPQADKAEAVYTASMIVYIDKVNNTKLMKEEVEQWLDELDIIDSRIVKKTIEKLDSLYGFVEQIKTKCPNCGNEVKHGLPITNELFDPSK